MATEPEVEKTTRKKNYEPDSDKDFQLSGIRIDDAENGVVIKCEYRLKPEIEQKMRKSQQSIPYYGDNSESHVFEDKADALKFITGELSELFGAAAVDSETEEGEEE